MIMVVHEAVSVAQPVIAFVDVSKDPQKGLPVLVIFKDGFLFIPAGRDVIDGAGIFYAEGTRHSVSLSEDY
jgi:hypothetical protein